MNNLDKTTVSAMVAKKYIPAYCQTTNVITDMLQGIFADLSTKSMPRMEKIGLITFIMGHAMCSLASRLEIDYEVSKFEILEAIKQYLGDKT